LQFCQANKQSKMPSCSSNNALEFRSIFSIFVGGRLVLSLIGLEDVLKHDHQLSSALTSYSNCAYKRNSSGVCPA